MHDHLVFHIFLGEKNFILCHTNEKNYTVVRLSPYLTPFAPFTGWGSAIRTGHQYVQNLTLIYEDIIKISTASQSLYNSILVSFRWTCLYCCKKIWPSFYKSWGHYSWATSRFTPKLTVLNCLLVYTLLILGILKTKYYLTLQKATLFVFNIFRKYILRT